VGGEAADRFTAELDGARRRPLEARDELQKRALAGPVGTDDGDDLAVVDPERDTVDGRETAEAFCDRVDLEKQPSPSATTLDDTESAAVT
jgi:hypothetical protein